jgi:hypothetical protein
VCAKYFLQEAGNRKKAAPSYTVRISVKSDDVLFRMCPKRILKNEKQETVEFGSVNLLFSVV